MYRQFQKVTAPCLLEVWTAFYCRLSRDDDNDGDKRSSIVSFAGVDPAVDESGKHISKSNPTTKRGSPHLRKTLYQIVCTYLRKAPVDEPVYQFLDKKRAKGKPYFVYMTAAQNKFLRIYYARVKECLNAAGAKETAHL